MPYAREILLAALEEQRPVVLMLGQSTLPSTDDPVLSRTMERLGSRSDTGLGWSGIRSQMPVTAEFYEWLSERFHRRAPTSRMEALAKVPWSAVFTSSLDPTLVNLFASSEREPEIVLTSDEIPRVVRSKIRPPLYYLFSRAGERDPIARPPADQSEFNRRRTQHAVPLLNRALDTATTLGLIVVEGYVPGCDWLRVDDLLGTIGDAAPNQILWFGGRPEMPTEIAPEFDAAVEAGRILISQERLANLINELDSTGRLSDIAPPNPEEAGSISFLDGNRLETTPEERLRVTAAASIVDDSWTAFLPPLGDDTDYALFRRFHGDTEGPRLLVEGVRRSYAIQRDFEKGLHERVLDAIENHASIRTPIVVKGQSGTGKSVALARIVARVRSTGAAAVLYAVDRIPQPQEISDFCEKAEDAGAKVTLIVCDANRDADLYHDLLTGLRSRGRRIVVLGSQYYTPEGSNAQSGINIEAPVELSVGERNELAELLSQYFDRPNPDLLQDNHILAFMYRFLPASRPRIRTGLGDEALATEHVLRRYNQMAAGRPLIGELHLEMIRAGLVEGYEPIFDRAHAEALAQGDDAAGHIINWVMVAGSLGCPVPFNLLLRAAKAHFTEIDLTVIAGLFRELDLFRWTSDGYDNDLLISPRLTLEAQILCSRRLGGAEVEAARIIELIGSVRFGLDRAQETNFLLNLLQQVSGDGPRGERYKESYAEIGRKLTDMRTRLGVVDPRLMLQESAFRRSAIRLNDGIDDVEHLALLEEARNAVQEALEGVDAEEISAPPRTKRNLLVERATVYGFLARYRAQRSQSDLDIWTAYDAARRVISRAVNIEYSYHPVDVALWTPADLLDYSAALSTTHRVELAADIYANLDLVEFNALPPRQRDRFLERKMRVGATIQDVELHEDAFRELDRIGSTAGIYLRARSFFPELSEHTTEVFTHEHRTNAKRAVDFLASYRDRIENDARCLSLLLECMWVSEMGRRPLHGERQPLPADDRARREALRTVRALNSANGESARYTTRYLEAVLTWLTGDFNDARRLFQSLANDTDYESAGRVVRRHLITDASGAPVRFDGRIEGRPQYDNWSARVLHFGENVHLRSRDFRDEEFAYGQTIRGFAIAFNFIGPIADPVRDNR